jgi:hypothetical protein
MIVILKYVDVKLEVLTRLLLSCVSEDYSLVRTLN